MKSPFPGMDPYLEQHWRDIHHRLVTYASDQLQEQLPADLLARVEERVYVESDSVAERGFYPDVRVIEHAGPIVGTAATTSARGNQPVVIDLEAEPATEGFIEIIDAGSGHQVVTVIEILSLSNKLPGEGQFLYRRKQDELKRGGVSLVEIDLLREGKRVLCIPISRIPPALRTPYQVCVRRGWLPNKAEVYAVPLREPLPAIHVPLRPTDPDAKLDLQLLIDQCYRNGRYHATDYTVDPVPPLLASDAEWLAESLKNAGRR